jgi:glycosyltransferase involved in cell wall biosynthesis
MFVWISGVLIGSIWVWHVVEGGLGMRHLAKLTDPEWDWATPPDAPSVSLIVPARNEAATIEPALGSLLALEYPNNEVIVVDDRSTDSTGSIIDRLAREQGSDHLRVIHITELPSGWLGKTHAMWRAARESRSEWLLFTDADCVFRPDTLRRAVAYAERERADHLVLFPTPIFKSWDEKMVMAFFQIMFVFAHRPWKVADPNTKDHIGMGAFNMVRRSVYEKIGTYERLRLAVIDDIKLGEIIKHSGFAQRNAVGRGLVSLHWATGAFGILHNLTKNFFAQMRFSLPLALAGVAATLILNWLPFAGAFFAHGWARLPFILALVSILLMYVNLHREGYMRSYYFFLHPLAALLLVYAVLRSAFITLKSGGIEWRGTKYSLEELRKGLN